MDQISSSKDHDFVEPEEPAQGPKDQVWNVAELESQLLFNDKQTKIDPLPQTETDYRLEHGDCVLSGDPIEEPKESKRLYQPRTASVPQPLGLSRQVFFPTPHPLITRAPNANVGFTTSTHSTIAVRPYLQHRLFLLEQNTGGPPQPPAGASGGFLSNHQAAPDYLWQQYQQM